MERILVAGGTGTNGQALLKRLSQQGIKCRALVRDLEKASAISEYAELVQGDLAEVTTLLPAFEGVNKAYVVTGIHRDTPQWFENFFTVAKQAGVSRLVKLSGLGASVDSPSEIIRQHAHSDNQLMESGLSYTILRPNSFFQNMLWQADSIKHQSQFFLPVGEAKQSLVDIRDIADATVKILTEPGHDHKIYDLTGPESLSFHDVAAILTQVLNKKISYVPISGEDAKAAMLQAGMPEWDAHVLTEIQLLFATGRYATPEPDLETLLGHRPRIFERFVQDFREQF